MRVAVIGGTGLVGRHASRALHHAGHDAVVVARSTGTDVFTGAGLDAALAGVEAVIDVTNTTAQNAAVAREFFAASTGTFLPPSNGRVSGITWCCPSSVWIASRATRMAGDVLLPGPDAQIAPTTFDTWLAAEAASAS